MFHCLAASPCAPESDELQSIPVAGTSRGRFGQQFPTLASKEQTPDVALDSARNNFQHFMYHFPPSPTSNDEFSFAQNSLHLPERSGPVTPADISNPGGSSNSARSAAPRSQSAGRSHGGGSAHSGNALRLGICAREKKARSKPMREIVRRLEATGHFVAVPFTDDTLINCPIDEWPRVDALIAFYSSGFPLEKAIAYVEATRPFCLNNLHMERVLRDRRLFYSTLTRNGIPVPKHVFCSRDGPTPPRVVEEDDYLEVDGVRINKPFVEKPVDAEDHNVYIYYPRRLGGGSKRLFRKVGNRSSQFYADVNAVRRNGSFIYEEFIMTQGTDIKLYVVGPDYTHAEARKSPVVDGIVQRDSEGKELRFPILLTAAEKAIARRVCLAFKANVCGFDLLRMHSQSFVCDVNGWSFVKKSVKYYDDTAAILGVIMLRSLAPHRLKTRAADSVPGSNRGGLPPLAMLMGSKRRKYSFQLPNSMPRPLPLQARPSSDAEESSSQSHLGAPGATAQLTNSAEQLRCVTAVIRHGDRTPKQKLKITVSHPALLRLMAEHSSDPRSEAKLKTAGQLQQALDVVRSVLEAYDERMTSGSGSASAGRTSASDTEGDAENIDKLRQVRAVLERGGAFSGVNRKVQLKPTKWEKRPRRVGGAARRSATSRSTKSSLVMPMPGQDGAGQQAPIQLQDDACSAQATAASLASSPPAPHSRKKNKLRRRSTSLNTTLGISNANHSHSKGRRSLRAASQDEGEEAADEAEEGEGGLNPEDALVMGAQGAKGLLDHETLDDTRMLARLRVLSGVPMDSALEAVGSRSSSVGPHPRHSRGASLLSLDAKLDSMAAKEGRLGQGDTLFRTLVSPAISTDAAERQPEHDAYEAGHDLSTSDSDDELEVAVEATLVLKWGGVLTDRGRSQAVALGQRFRQLMYPGESTALLRLHSTYRHDLKIYASDEGRVQMTAACFAKGLLDLEGDLTPILASLVRYDNTGGMLDSTAAARPLMAAMKEKLRHALTKPGGYKKGMEGGGSVPPPRAYLSDSHLTSSATTPALSQTAGPAALPGRSLSHEEKKAQEAASRRGSALGGEGGVSVPPPPPQQGRARPSALLLPGSDTDGSTPSSVFHAKHNLKYRGGGSGMRTSVSLTTLARAGGSPLLGKGGGQRALWAVNSRLH